MGGAERAAKRRKQDEALAAQKPRPQGKAARTAGPSGTLASDRDPRRTVFVVVAVLAVVAAVIWAVVFLTRDRDTAPAVAPTYTATAADGVVTAGSGPVEIDVYTDYLCPFCEQFEQNYGDELTTALNADQVTVRFHQIAILDERTDPVGYSTRAASAALCAADLGFYPAYAAQLWEQQPSEGSAGLTDEELVAIGTDLGAPAEFGTCVGADAHSADVATATAAALADPVAAPGGQFGTPTVVADGAVVDTSNGQWLAELIG